MPCGYHVENLATNSSWSCKFSSLSTGESASEHGDGLASCHGCEGEVTYHGCSPPQTEDTFYEFRNICYHFCVQSLIFRLFCVALWLLLLWLQILLCLLSNTRLSFGPNSTGLDYSALTAFDDTNCKRWLCQVEEGCSS